MAQRQRFAASYTNDQGFTTSIQGNLRQIDGEQFLEVAKVGRPDDPFQVGEVRSLEEVNEIVEQGQQRWQDNGITDGVYIS